MIKKSIPIGVSDFKKLITEDYLFVDKTLFIKELLDDAAGALLFPRPRRFGKTLNLSMLKYFFSNTEEGARDLFKGLAIEKAGEQYMCHQGQYPVIFLSFKDVKCSNMADANEALRGLLAELYREHRYLSNSEKLFPEDKGFIQSILEETSSLTHLRSALKRLLYFLYQHYGQKVIVLIDEYDTPIHEAYLHNYYEDMIGFMRNFLSAGLKDTIYVQQAIITGILRVGKESIFSGLNHVKPHSVLDIVFGEFFGFTQLETDNLFKQAGLQDQMADIEVWYNGYQMAGVTIYNPWSILNCIDKKGLKEAYWVNTAGNELIKELLGKSSVQLKENLELLINGQAIQAVISETMGFRDLSNDDASLWHLLLFAGYLTALGKTLNDRGQWECTLSIPNKEVSSIYFEIVGSWFQDAINSQDYDVLLSSLITGNIPRFSHLFKELVLESFSFFDISGKQPEQIYHAFVLGLLAQLRNTHALKSNRESGYGRYDVMLIPKDISQLGVVIEFKKREDEKNLEETAKSALKQINEKHYDTELKQLGITRILKLAIVFAGKEVLILSEP